MTSIIDPYFDKAWKITDGPDAGCRFINACQPRHEGLIVKGCRNMSAITELPSQLKVLVIFSCDALERINYLPPHLKLLCLFDNKNLHELPDLRSSYNLDALAVLGCPRLDLGRSPYPPTLKELEFELRRGFDLKQLPENLWSCVMTRPDWGQTSNRVGRILKGCDKGQSGVFWID